MSDHQIACPSSVKTTKCSYDQHTLCDCRAQRPTAHFAIVVPSALMTFGSMNIRLSVYVQLIYINNNNYSHVVVARPAKSVRPDQ